MLPLTVRAVCLNILSFAYLTESFVLLTANVEDIKQIAKKFLTESLSDQISEFISKAKLQDAISVENERNANEFRNSRERETSFVTDTYRLDKPDEEFGYQPTNINANERSDKFGYQPNSDGVRNGNHEKNKGHRVDSDRQRLKIDSAFMEPDNDEFKKNVLNRYELKPKNIPRMGLASSRHLHQKNLKKSRLTTEKQRKNEFDQYDNTNYARNELLATSGQLSLPRVRGFNRQS